MSLPPIEPGRPLKILKDLILLKAGTQLPKKSRFYFFCQESNTSVSSSEEDWKLVRKLSLASAK